MNQAVSSGMRGYSLHALMDAVIRADPNMDAVAAEYTTLLRASVSAAADTGLGDLQELSIVTEKMVALLVAITPFPKVATEHRESENPEAREFRRLLHKPQFLFSVAAQFFYVGGQVCIWSFMIRYAQVEVPGLGEKVAAGFLIAALCGLFAGRAAGAALMSRIHPALMLAVFTCINLGLLTVAVGIGGEVGLYALATMGFFMSISFPTIFALGIKDLGNLTKTASSFIVMSIVGGAILPLLLGRVSDHSSIRIGFIVPGLCFAVVALFAFYAFRNARRAGETALS